MSLLGASNYGSRYVEPRQPRLAHPLGNLTLVTPPVGLVVTVEEVKQFARADLDTSDEDDLILRLIRANTERAQKMIPGWRQLLAATYQVSLSSWFGRALRLPLPPLRGVDWVKYIDQAGATQTLDAAYYEVRTPQRSPGEIDRAPYQNWPSAAWPLLRRQEPYPVTVQFVAGYPDGMVPETIRDAIIWRAAAEFNNRVACNGEMNLDKPFEDMLGLDAWGSYSGEP